MALRIWLEWHKLSAMFEITIGLSRESIYRPLIPFSILIDVGMDMSSGGLLGDMRWRSMFEIQSVISTNRR